ncbi:MAG: hypothetical protein JXC33_02865 [Deltaproteobacteria bacterium]|nr:hypothetical protein [Deltaproteobacteria bacterium]
MTRMADITIFRSYIVTGILAVFFLLSACVFFTVFNNYSSDHKKLQALKGELRVIMIQQKELKRKKRIVTRVANFVKRATSYGLEKDRWTYYDVEIEEPMTFHKAEQILSQTLSTSSYFYKPMVLHMNTDITTYKKPEQNQPSGRSADSKSIDGQDVVVKLKGAFLVQH